jgi:hypothetical protein
VYVVSDESIVEEDLGCLTPWADNMWDLWYPVAEAIDFMV